MAASTQQRSAKQSPFDGFPGYDTPHYTQIPDQFFDEHLRFLGGSEAKIMLVLFRQTLGWKKRSESLSLTQIASRGGLSKRTVQRALPELETKGLVVVDRETTQAGDPATNRYTVRMRQNVPTPVGGWGQNVPTPGSACPHGRDKMSLQENRHTSKNSTSKRGEPSHIDPARQERLYSVGQQMALKVYHGEMTPEEAAKIIEATMAEADAQDSPTGEGETQATAG